MKKINLVALMFIVVFTMAGQAVTLDAKEAKINNWHRLGSDNLFITPEEATEINKSCGALDKLFSDNNLYVALVNESTQEINYDTMQPYKSDQITDVYWDTGAQDATCSTGGVIDAKDGKVTELGMKEPVSGYATIMSIFVLADPTDLTTYPDDLWIENIDVENDTLTIPVNSEYDPVAMHGITTSEYETRTDTETTFPSTTAENVYISSNVNTLKAGTYTTNVRVERRKPIGADGNKYQMFTENKFLTVNVVDTNPLMVMADSKQVKVSDAPKTEADLLSLMDVVAINTSTHEVIPGADITVNNLDDYNFTAPEVGEYDFNFKVEVVMDGQTFYNSVDATLSVVDDSTPIINSKIIGPSALAYKVGEAPSLSDLIDENNYYIADYTEDTLNGFQPLTSANVVDNGKYDPATAGIYTIELKATSATTGNMLTKYVQVEVYTDVPTTDYVSIDASNITLNTGATYDPFAPYQGVVVEYTDAEGVIQTTTTPQSDTNLEVSTFGTVDTSTPGEYTIVYTVKEKDTLATDQKLITVTVRDFDITKDVAIIANDATVLNTAAPTTVDELKTLMGVRAYDPVTGSEIATSEITVDTPFTYDTAVGSYAVTFYAKGDENSVASVTKTLKLTDDPSEVSTYSWAQNDFLKFQVGATTTLQDAVESANVVLTELTADGGEIEYPLNSVSDVINMTDEQFIAYSKTEGTIPLVFQGTGSDGTTQQTVVLVDFVDEDPGIVTINAPSTLLLEQGSTYIEPNSYPDLEISYLDAEGNLIFMEPTTTMFTGDRVDPTAADGTEFNVRISVTSPINSKKYIKDITVTITTDSQDTLWTVGPTTVPIAPLNDNAIIDKMIHSRNYNVDDMNIIDYGGLTPDSPKVGTYTITFQYYDEATGITATNEGLLTVEA